MSSIFIMYFRYHYNLLSHIHMRKFHLNLTSDSISKEHSVKINKKKNPSLKMESRNPEGGALTHKELIAAFFTYLKQLTLPRQRVVTKIFLWPSNNQPMRTTVTLRMWSHHNPELSLSSNGLLFQNSSSQLPSFRYRKNPLSFVLQICLLFTVADMSWIAISLLISNKFIVLVSKVTGNFIFKVDITWCQK